MLTPNSDKPLPPPRGWRSWLEYAIATMDTRSLHLRSIDDDGGDWGRIVKREEMREAARAELNALLHPTKPPSSCKTWIDWGLENEGENLKRRDLLPLFLAELRTLREERDGLQHKLNVMIKSALAAVADISQADNRALRTAEARVEKLEGTLRSTLDYIEQLPSGIDKEADPMEVCPDDATAHIGGLIWQEVKEVLDCFRKTE